MVSISSDATVVARLDGLARTIKGGEHLGDELANDTRYGLGSGVWSSKVKTVMKMVHGIQAGTVWVNCYGLIDPAVGFGGYKDSGYGWKGGQAQIDGFQKAAYLNWA